MSTLLLRCLGRWVQYASSSGSVDHVAGLACDSACADVASGSAICRSRADSTRGTACRWIVGIVACVVDTDETSCTLIVITAGDRQETAWAASWKSNRICDGSQNTSATGFQDDGRRVPLTAR